MSALLLVLGIGAGLSFGSWGGGEPGIYAAWSAAAPLAQVEPVTYAEAYRACLADECALTVVVGQPALVVSRERQLAAECGRRCVVADRVDRLAAGVYVMVPAGGALWITEERHTAEVPELEAREWLVPESGPVRRCGPGGCR